MQPCHSGPHHPLPAIVAAAAGAAPDQARSSWVQGALSSVLKHRASRARGISPALLATGAVIQDALLRADHAGFTLPPAEKPRTPILRKAPLVPLRFESTTGNAVEDATPRFGVDTSPSIAPGTLRDAVTSASPPEASPAPDTPAFDLLALVQFDGLLRFKAAATWELEDNGPSNGPSAHASETAGGGRHTRRIPDYYFEFSNDHDPATTFVPDDVRIVPIERPIQTRVSLTEMYLANMLETIHREKHARRGQRVDPDWHRADRGLYSVASTAEQFHHARLGAKDMEAIRAIGETANRLQRPLLVMFPGDTLVWVSIDEKVMRTFLADETGNVTDHAVKASPDRSDVMRSGDPNKPVLDHDSDGNATTLEQDARSLQRFVDARDANASASASASDEVTAAAALSFA